MSWQQWVLIAWFSGALLTNVHALIEAGDRHRRVQHLASCTISGVCIWLAANA